jgi:hypothetical protein
MTMAASKESSMKYSWRARLLRMMVVSEVADLPGLAIGGGLYLHSGVN